MVRLLKSDRPRARDYSSRREQLRLLFLIVPLGLVIIVMARLRDANTANRINKFFSPVSTESSGETQPALDERLTQNRQGGPQAVDSAKFFPGIRADLLETIEDDTYFRDAEQEAWFHFIELLQRSPPEELARARGPEIDYAQLVEQPAFYRGKLVTVRGWVRQVTQQKPAANELGLESYFRVVIQPRDGGIWPIFAYCLELPDSLVRGEVGTEVSLPGIFFKNLSYQWQDGLGTAPVVLAKNIGSPPSADARSNDVAKRRIEAADHSPDETVATPVDRSTQPDSSNGPAAPFAAVMARAGWDAERLANFDDDKMHSDEQSLELLQLLWRIRSFDAAVLTAWARQGPTFAEIQSDPAAARGQLVRLSGQVRRVKKHGLRPADSERLEMPEYFECDVALDGNSRTASILTTRVPKSWLQTPSLDEPVKAIAMYVKQLPNDEAGAKTLWLAKQLEWYPTKPQASFVSLGQSVLGQLGMDVSLLGDVQNHRPIQGVEREPFYQMLGATTRTEPRRLIDLAQANIDEAKQAWLHELDAADAERRRLAKEVVRRAEERRYSVAPLFNDANNQVGQLFVFDGIVRRALRVEVAPPFVCPATDVLHRVRIDHYYEIELFTGDAQNHPLVFCVGKLPAGLPTGGELNVPARIAGFFFKDWLYRSRKTAQAEDKVVAAKAAGRPQYAPLLIGSAPVLLATAQGGGGWTRFVAGGLFLVALAGIWAAAVWYARDDRHFRERTPAAGFSLPPGQSLNELNLSVPDEPMK